MKYCPKCEYNLTAHKQILAEKMAWKVKNTKLRNLLRKLTVNDYKTIRKIEASMGYSLKPFVTKRVKCLKEYTYNKVIKILKEQGIEGESCE